MQDWHWREALIQISILLMFWSVQLCCTTGRNLLCMATAEQVRDTNRGRSLESTWGHCPRIKNLYDYIACSSLAPPRQQSDKAFWRPSAALLLFKILPQASATFSSGCLASLWCGCMLTLGTTSGHAWELLWQITLLDPIGFWRASDLTIKSQGIALSFRSRSS